MVVRHKAVSWRQPIQDRLRVVCGAAATAVVTPHHLLTCLLLSVTIVV